MAFKIKGSVGAKGKNAKDDVTAVQKALNDHKKQGGYSALKADGLIGPKTIGAIKSFQKNVVGGKVDGMVDPGGKTFAALSKKPGAAAEEEASASAKAGAGTKGAGPGGDGEDLADDLLLDPANLKPMMRLVARKPHNFGFGLASAAEECTFVAKKQGKPKPLMTLIKEKKKQKATFGIASADPEDKETLRLEVMGKQLPGMAKKLRKLFKANKATTFKKIVLIIDGQIVDDLPDEEEATHSAGPRAGAGAAASESARATAETEAAVGTATGKSVAAETVGEEAEYSADDDLTVIDTDETFEKDNMKAVMEETPKGSDSVKLNEAMEKLMALKSADDPAAEAYLKVICKETKSDMSRAKAQFNKFLSVRSQAEKTAASDDEVDGVDQINLEKHGDFLGSTASMRFGKMVGASFGLDPVFGAMLSPTGGMVGPGNTELYDPDDPNDPIVKHGVAHDAAGYLKNYHGEGPGYDYLGEEGNRNTKNPFVGQESGIQYWLDEDGRDDVTADLVRAGTEVWGAGLDVYYGVKKAGEKTVEAVGEAYDAVAEKANETYDWAAEEAEEAYDWASETYDEASEAVSEAYDEALSGAEEVYDWAGEKYDETADAAEEAYDWASDEAEEAMDWASDTASDVADSVGDAAETAWDTAGDAYDSAGESVDEALEYLDSLW